MNLGKLKLAGVNNASAAPAVSAASPTATAKPAAESTTVAVPVAPKPAGLKLGGLRLPARVPDSRNAPVATSDGTANAVSAAIPDAEVVDDKLPTDSPAGFQALLDRLDALIVAGQGVTQLTLDTSRKYVASIYTELKANPDLDPIFKDRDMHNVMAVVQRSTLQAKETIQKKKAKAESSAVKKSLVNADFGDMDFGFGDETPNQTATAIAVSKSMKSQDLMGFGDINTDEIAAQVSAARKK